MTDPSQQRARRRHRRSVPLLSVMICLLAVASCGSGAAPTSAASTTTTPATTTLAPGDTTPTSSLPVIDAPAVLQQAFDALGGGYHFVTTAIVNGEVAITAIGDRVADGTRMSVSSSGATIDYVVTPDGTWVNQQGTWSELSDPAPVSDPIGSLRAPISVQVASFTGTAQVGLAATYPSSALSLPGDAMVEVSFVLTGGSLVSLSYRTTGGGVEANVESMITLLADTSPVTLPQV